MKFNLLELLKNKNYFYIFPILLIGYATFIHNFHIPAAVFWDENYHIASAHKYIEGVMYMEPHPPLGKMIIALGEYIFSPNKNLDLAYFAATDYIKVFPKGYSFFGVRFFPVLFAALAGVLFFLILLKISKNAFLSFLFSFLYLFDNAIIVHSRSAMLEGIQIFFILGAILQGVAAIEKEKPSILDYVYMGLWSGAAVSVKLNGLILALLFAAVVLYDQRGNLRLASILDAFKEVFLKGVAFGVSLMGIFVLVFYVHFAFGEKFAKHTTYKASPEYKQIIQNKENKNPLNFAVMMRDNLKYISEYADGVPRFDPCKKGENGSIAATWPFGNKSINFRWEKKDGKVSYLYLQGNPIVWFGAFFGVVLGAALLIARFVFGLETKDKKQFFIISMFSVFYFSYMFVMFNIERVMYLYHYLVPLVFSMFILFGVVNYIFKEAIQSQNKLFYAAAVLFAVEIVWVWWFFSPLSYYKPLTTMEFNDRIWFDFWKLKPIL